jgi:DnaJ-class molecular chaperone
MSLKNYYQMLGVGRDANAEDIKKAFRKLVLRFHPDRNAGSSEEAEERFKEINEAYEVLGDEQKRLHYDRLIGWAGYRHETIVVEDIFGGTFKDSMDLDLIREIMQTFADLDPTFTAFNHRRSWGCKRQRGWRCRREQWQE